jgi:hypothetical protein
MATLYGAQYFNGGHFFQRHLLCLCGNVASLKSSHISKLGIFPQWWQLFLNGGRLPILAMAIAFFWLLSLFWLLPLIWLLPFFGSFIWCPVFQRRPLFSKATALPLWQCSQFKKWPLFLNGGRL